MKVLSLSAIAWTTPLVAAAAPERPADVQAVKAVLARYHQAIERLDMAGTAELFASQSDIVESGRLEGTYRNYLDHHLNPELGGFQSFAFSDYKVSVRFEGPVALATESYRYRIVPKSGAPAERIGAATSVLRKVGGQWKIVSMHSSARRPAAP